MKNILFWALAVVITLSSAVYQRTTGPTYAVDGETEFDGRSISYSLVRSHGGNSDQEVAIFVGDGNIEGALFYRRYKTGDQFTSLPMKMTDNRLVAFLPHQPPAGKLEYYLELYGNDKTKVIPDKETVVTRFKGAVPKAVLFPHIILMFSAMLFSARTGLEALRPDGKTLRLTFWTTMILLVGGMIMGPVVQKLAFGDLWTGIPFGWDLTDNKTLIAFAGWVLALIMHRFNKFPRYWVLAAAIILLIIFAIPHSTMGSELDYSTGEVKVG